MANQDNKAKRFRPNTSFKAKSKSAKGKHRTQNQAGAKAHFKKKSQKKLAQEEVKNYPVRHEKETSELINQSVQYITFDADLDGQRLDNYLRKKLVSIPNSRIYNLLRKGEIRVNKKRVKPDYKIVTGDILRLPPLVIVPKTVVYIPQQVLQRLKDSVIFEDSDYMIINKPAGIAVHGGSKTEFGVIDIVRQAFVDQKWELCHRLDKDTSGCLVFANSRKALNHFQRQSLDHQLYKQYLTLVKGTWMANELMINIPTEKQDISRMNAEGEFEKVVEGGEKEAISIFTTRQHYAKTTLMQVVIKTGRTHQIRVHSAAKKHPIAMDDKYGDFKWNRALQKLGLTRMFLHAHVIRFTGLSETIHVSAELPDDLQTFIQKHCE